LLKKFHYGNFDQKGFHRGMSVELDTSDFEPKLDKFMLKSAIIGLRKGLGLAWTELMKDIVSEIPTAPILTSALRGSITVFVNKVLVAASRYGIPLFQQRKNTEPKYRKGEEALLVVNAPYATIQHEKFENKSEPSAGRFYVLKKLVQFRNKYGKIVVDEMKKVRV